VAQKLVEIERESTCCSFLKNAMTRIKTAMFGTAVILLLAGVAFILFVGAALSSPESSEVGSPSLTRVNFV
jgi:hypothetical protein